MDASLRVLYRLSGVMKVMYAVRSTVCTVIANMMPIAAVLWLLYGSI